MRLPRLTGRALVQWLGLLGGPLLALAVYLALPGSYADAGGAAVDFTRGGRVTAALAAWMAVWWMTEAIPVYATALLPLAVLPLGGAASVRAAAAPYGHELIFLFMGGFVLALSMQRWGLHRRIAYLALGLVGTRPRHIVGAFMLITALFSMWVSNTATAVMMLPIALSVIGLVTPAGGDDDRTLGALPQGEGRNFALCMLLGVAYAASIGGLGTLIGTPPNLFLASFVAREAGVEIGFARWMLLGLPLVAVFLPVAWLLLTRVLYPVRLPRLEGAATLTRRAYAALGPMRAGEWATFVVFVLTAAAWILRPLIAAVEWNGDRPFAGLSDAGIAIIAALLLFVIPVDVCRRTFVMDWDTAVKLPWGLLVLFGGGLSLAAAIQANGVGEYIASRVAGLAGVPELAVIAVVTALTLFLTELSSNTATAATLVPILYGLAPGLGMDPLLLIVAAALAASCAFMLPVATPPNAVVFGSGLITIAQMVRAGIWLNLIGVVLIVAVVKVLAPVVLGG